MRAVVGDAAGTVALLSREPQVALGWFSRFIAFLTTPFKRIGISGWRETGCAGEGGGSPVRDAQHSTDGFYTIDVALAALTVGAEVAPQAATCVSRSSPGRARTRCAQRRPSSKGCCHVRRRLGDRY